jgi:hypothetical protein
MFQKPSPAASRNTRANGSLINGFSLSVSVARAPATPSAVAPTLSVISQLSLSVLAMVNLPTRCTYSSRIRRANAETTCHRPRQFVPARRHNQHTAPAKDSLR